MSNVKTRLNKPLLVLLYGFPGAGKTYFARNLADTLESAHVHSDRIRHELFEEPRFDEQENGIITHLMNYMTEEFLGAGVPVIYDTNMIRKSQRRRIREMARKKKIDTLVVWFQIDPDTAFARLKKRDKRKTDDKYAVDYNQDKFRKYAAKMQHPEVKENYIVVSGKHAFSSQKTALFKKLAALNLISLSTAQSHVTKPGLVNLVPTTFHGRVDLSRRNINIR